MTFGFGFGAPRRLGVGGAFSPASLFAAGEVGAWYDPSDLTTLFTDTAGTTPVTTPGQTVALMLDKSRGLALGTELVVNGTFDSGISGWTSGLNSPTLSWVPSGAMRVTRTISTATFSVTSQTISGFTVGRTYVATANFSNVSPGTNPYIAINSVAIGTSRLIFVATSSSHLLEINTTTGAAGTAFDVDNVSICELLGNHATQATAAQRPTYGIEPMTGRRNLLLRSESFISPWAVATGSITATNLVAPDGTTTGSTLTASGGNTRVLQTVSGQTAGATYTFSAYVKASASGGASNVRLSTNDSFSWNTGQSQRFTLTSDWQRMVLTGVLSSGSAILVNIGSIDVAGNNDPLCAGNIDIWGAQLERGSVATAYQRVTTQFDVTEAGVASKSYLFFDGVDDGMLTGTITPSTDKAQVFAGVRKLSDAARGTVAEYTASAAANDGAWHLTAPNAASATFAFESKGTLLTDAVATGFAAPTTRVLTGIGDISGDSTILRANGVQADVDTGDQGTGNYASSVLYVGRRGGTSLPLSGQIYSLITRFSATNLDAATITSTETWVNSKTGAY